MPQMRRKCFCSAERAFVTLSAYFIYKVSGAAYFSAFRRLLPFVLLGAVKNIKLIRPAEFDEVGNVACYTNKQVFVIFGLLHRLAQGVAVDYIELNMIVAQCFKGAEVVYAKVAAEMLLHIIYLKFYNKDLYDTRFYRLNFEMANKLMAASSIEEVESISDEAFRSIFLFFNVEGNHGERKTISPLIIKYLEENYKNEIKISNIEKITYMTSAYASRLFKKETSLTIKTCLINIRMKHAQELLLNTDMPIKDIAAEVGYTDIRGFYKMFSQHFGITCSEMRENRVEGVKQP